jgi:hypothetical protein
MSAHELKTWPAYFGDIARGVKTFEVRRDDRDFKTGDVLQLAEYDPHTGYTGRVIARRVTYLLPGGAFGVQEGYVVMGLAESPDRGEE